MRKQESGSAHAIVIGVLAVALLGAIGVLFWQNIINKPTKVASTVTTPSASPSPILKNFCASQEKLCFDYPSNWTVKQNAVDPQTYGVAERFVISDQTGAAWLKLQTGMGGLGGSCGNNDGSYSKILKTHTSGVQGSYLVNEAAKDFMVDTAYALNWITYNGTEKNWTIHMDLNDSKTAQNVGKVDPCDIGLGVINGKNAKADGSDNAGGVEFKLYTGSDQEQTYSTEATATAALSTPNATKAYAILQSAHYK